MKNYVRGLTQVLMVCSLLFGIFLPLVGASQYTMNLVPGIIYKPFESGIIMFENAVTSSGLYFDDFLVFNNLNGKFSKIGFKCTPLTTNVTITELSKVSDKREIRLTVYGPTLTESITKIYVEGLGKPSEVLGANYWSFSENVITLRVIHESSRDIIIKWERETPPLMGAIWGGFAMVTLIPVVMVCAIVMGAMKGNVDMDLVTAFMTVSVSIAIAVMVLAALTSLA